MKKINLKEILFIEIDKLRKDFPEDSFYSNEEIESSPEFPYFINATRESIRQSLELAAKNAKSNLYQDGNRYFSIADEQSILNTINQIE